MSVWARTWALTLSCEGPCASTPFSSFRVCSRVAGECIALRLSALLFARKALQTIMTFHPGLQTTMPFRPGQMGTSETAT